MSASREDAYMIARLKLSDSLLAEIDRITTLTRSPHHSDRAREMATIAANAGYALPRRVLVRVVLTGVCTLAVDELLGDTSADVARNRARALCNWVRLDGNAELAFDPIARTWAMLSALVRRDARGGDTWERWTDLATTTIFATLEHRLLNSGAAVHSPATFMAVAFKSVGVHLLAATASIAWRGELSDDATLRALIDHAARAARYAKDARCADHPLSMSLKRFVGLTEEELTAGARAELASSREALEELRPSVLELGHFTHDLTEGIAAAAAAGVI